ncbi:MAG: xylulokinase [Acidimicrobiia bacterium]|nr:xylulokinase [Acidimicrobiia bacterium]MDX2467994.1 xylulokinase [Acidimicrobiia bacterium]
MTYVIGIDSSTTATKAQLVDAQGSVVAVVSSEYEYETPQPLWSEQAPDLWWTATKAAISGVLAIAGVRGDEVAAIGLTGQMHGLVLLDEAGQVLRPSILWNDQRTSAECDEIRDRVGKDRLIRITGNDALTGFTAPKILWVRNNEPEIFDKARHVLLPKDYVRLRLTGEYASDKAGGAGTILFDLSTRTWSDEILADLDLDRSMFPDTFEGHEVTGTVTTEAAAATGLAAGTPVVAGAGDQAANGVAVGAIDPGVVGLSLGTSGVVFTATDTPSIEPEGRLHAFCHGVADRWHFMGVMLSAAGSLRWLRDTVAPGTDFGDLSAAAGDIAAGSEGLLFLPYLTGERTPHPDPLARGAFVGLTVRHERDHLTRAVLEGVSFGLRDSFELIRSAGSADLTEVRASGGGTRSPIWRQILADVLNAEIRTVATAEGAAQGAAMLAAVGAGWFSSAQEASAAWLKLDPATAPGDNVAVYGQIYESYRGLYPALAETMHQLSAR